MKYFVDKRRGDMVQNFLDLKNNAEMQKKFTILQNEISVAFNTKVLAVTSIHEDKLSAAFAKAMADAYAMNNSSACLIDANLFDPCLKGLVGEEGDKPQELKVLDDKSGVIFMDKEIYPSTIYKSGAVKELVEKASEKYEHVIVLVPSVDEHKEIALLADCIDSALVLTMRGWTKKKEIFYALQYLYEQKIPVSKTVILK